MRLGFVLPAACALGFLAVVTQTVLLREFLSVTDGNELILGLVLACWMVLTGAGAFLARRSPANAEFRLHDRIVILSVLPLCTAIGLRAVKGLLFAPGTVPGLWETLLVSVILLAPFCFSAGHTFVRLAERFVHRQSSIASAYGWEAAGSVVGGLAGFLVTDTMAGNIPVLCGLVVFGAGFAIASIRRDAASWLRAAVAVLLAVIAVAGSGTIDSSSRRWLFAGQEIMFARDTPYGSVVVAEHAGQRNLYENGLLLSSSGDIVGREEATHFAMVQRSRPREVLLVSGAASGILDEVLKYPVRTVVYVELNGGIRAAAPFLGPPPDDARLKPKEGDVRTTLASAPGPYDVVLINTPDPTTAQTDRLFTLEFLRLARSCMTDSSVLALSLLPTVEYYGGRARLVASSVFGTLKSVFPYVVAIPGERNYLLASGAPLETGIAGLVEARKISTTAVNRYYIDDELLRSRSRSFVDGLDTLARPNTDLHPVAYFRQIAFWLESFGIPAEYVGWGVTILVLMGFLGVSPVGRGVYAAGFAAAGVEVIVLLGYQCLYGFVYHSLWLVIGGFMGGLAAGSAWISRISPPAARRWFILGLLALACIALMSAGALEALVAAGRMEFPGMALLLGLIVLSGGATGIVFGAGSMIETGGTHHVAGTLYSADLAGSALGSLAAAVFLVPMLGTSIAAGSMAILPLAAVAVYRVRGS